MRKNGQFLQSPIKCWPTVVLFIVLVTAYTLLIWYPMDLCRTDFQQSSNAILSMAAAGNNSGQPSHRCYSMSDFSEFCVYQNVCLGDHQLLFDRGLVPRSSQGQYGSGEAIDSYQNLPALETGSLSDMRHRLLPHRSFLNLGVAEADVSQLMSSRQAHAELGFLTGFDSDTPNLFHFAESILLYHAAQQLNGTIFDLPPLSVALLDRPAPPRGSWIQDFATLVFADTADLPSRFPLVGWSDKVRTYSADAPLCFRRLIIGGTIIHLTLGPRDAETLKAKAYEMLQISQVPRPNPLPRRILVEIRQQRSWTNQQEILEVLQRIGVPFETICFADLSFADQVKAMATAGVFCSAHGAGMTNLLWMPTGAAVLEVFPSEVWDYNLYGEVARNAGLFHVPVHGNLSEPTMFSHTGNTIRGCLNDPVCNLHFKKDFYIDPRRFERGLRRALSLAGIETP